MKLLKSIFASFLITISNVTLAKYVAHDNGQATTTEATCLKLALSGKLVSKPCSDATKFILKNKKFCLKKTSTYCLSEKEDNTTTFSGNSGIHLSVEFDEECGCLSVDNLDGTAWYKYSIKHKTFMYHKALTTGIVDGLWKKGDDCWTTVTYNNSAYSEIGNRIFLQKCRSEATNSKQNKTQSWELEDRQLRTSDGRLCVYVKNTTRTIATTRCSREYDEFKLSDDGEIEMINKPGMCLTDKDDIDRNKLRLGKCATKLKSIDSIVLYQYTVFKSPYVTYSQFKNVARIGTTRVHQQIILIRENWNYYKLKMNIVGQYSNFGVAKREETQFISSWGLLGYGKKGLGCYSGGGFEKMYSYLGASKLDFNNSQEYVEGSEIKVIKTDTYVEFRCLSCGNTMIHKHVFTTGDATDVYPALDLFTPGDSYDMKIF